MKLEFIPIRVWCLHCGNPRHYRLGMRAIYCLRCGQGRFTGTRRLAPICQDGWIATEFDHVFLAALGIVPLSEKEY